MEECLARDAQSGHQALRRHEQDLWWLRSAIKEALLDDFNANAAVQTELPSLEEGVRKGTISPFDAAEALLKLFKGKS